MGIPPAHTQDFIVKGMGLVAPGHCPNIECINHNNFSKENPVGENTVGQGCCGGEWGGKIRKRAWVDTALEGYVVIHCGHSREFRWFR
jgi:hypothetical protein